MYVCVWGVRYYVVLYKQLNIERYYVSYLVMSRVNIIAFYWSIAQTVSLFISPIQLRFKQRTIMTANA